MSLSHLQMLCFVCFCRLLPSKSSVHWTVQRYSDHFCGQINCWIFCRANSSGYIDLSHLVSWVFKLLESFKSYILENSKLFKSPLLCPSPNSIQSLGAPKKRGPLIFQWLLKTHFLHSQTEQIDKWKYWTPKILKEMSAISSCLTPILSAVFLQLCQVPLIYFFLISEENKHLCPFPKIS